MFGAFPFTAEMTVVVLSAIVLPTRVDAKFDDSHDVGDQSSHHNKFSSFSVLWGSGDLAFEALDYHQQGLGGGQPQGQKPTGAPGVSVSCPSGKGGEK